VPRYDTGAWFLGYHGGVIDRTDYRGAQDALSDVRRRLIGAQEQERARIGRELHDNVSQRLAVLAIKIDEIRNALPARAGKIAARMASLRAVSHDVAHEVHGLSHRLHSIKLEALGLVGALRGHCGELSRHGIRVRFSEVDVPEILSDDAVLCVFRVVQEALANVVKHSGAAEARVMLSGGDSEIVLRVEDSGRGFEPETQSSGLGLISMRERVRLVGGDLKICSTPRHGAAIEARIPIHMSRLQAGRSLPAA
jgi:signal transduction histidine kinase